MINFIKVVVVLAVLSACTGCAVSENPEINIVVWVVIIISVILLFAWRVQKADEKEERIFLLVFDFKPKGGTFSAPEAEIVKNKLKKLEEEFKTASGEEAILKKKNWQTAQEVAKDFFPDN